MKYKVLEILPGQIKVEFEDESWAFVPVLPGASLEEIDNSVANYDPDFLPTPEELINKNLSVGLERSSKKMESSNQLPTVETNPQPTTPYLDLSAFADYFAQKGDTRLQDALKSRFETIISNPEFSLDDLISQVLAEDVDVLQIAEDELNAEQS